MHETVSMQGFSMEDPSQNLSPKISHPASALQKLSYKICPTKSALQKANFTSENIGILEENVHVAS